MIQISQEMNETIKAIFLLVILFRLLYILYSSKTMTGRQYTSSYRKYYVDHPTSVNHCEKYLIPLQNQYSVLNQSRNPYAALDRFSVDILQKSQAKGETYLRNLGKESLDMELKEWEKRQFQKENEYRMMRSEVKQLQGMAKLKEMEYQIERLSRNKKNHNQSVIMPFPMFMPFMGNQMNRCAHSCNCQCSCSCQANRSCNCQGHRCSQQPPKKYKPVLTQNCAVQTDPQPITSISSIQSMRPMKLPTVEKIPTQKAVIPPPQIKKMSAQKKKNLLRKLRIYSYAIYFCIYFKWFSFQFSLNRYTNFKNKYLLDSGKTLTENYRQVYQELLKIDIPQLIRLAASKIQQPNTVTQKFDITTLLKNQSAQKIKKMKDFTIISNNYETLFLRCGQFILGLLNEVSESMQNWDWGDVGYGLGVGSLNQSFVIDDIFLPHEIYLLMFHDQKGYARIGRNSQKVLIMTKFIVKLLLYNVCLQLDNNKEWFQMHQQKLKQSEDLEQIFILLQIASKILFIFCQNIYEYELNDKLDHNPNYDDLDHKFKIEPCNPLVYSHTIKKRRQLFKKEDIKQSNLLIYGIQKLDQVNNIINLPFFKKMHKRINSKIGVTLDSILEKVKQSNRQKYQQIWEETVANQYIVLRGLKQIMKPNKFYPYASATVVASKTNLNSKRTLTKRTIQSKIPSYSSKISIQNKLQKFSDK